MRGRLGVREALVRTRTRYISLIRALLRQQGYRVPSGSAEGFVHRVDALALPGQLHSLIAPLLAVMAVGLSRSVILGRPGEPQEPQKRWHSARALPGATDRFR